MTSADIVANWRALKTSRQRTRFAENCRAEIARLDESISTIILSSDPDFSRQIGNVERRIETMLTALDEIGQIDTIWHGAA